MRCGTLLFHPLAPSGDLVARSTQDALMGTLRSEVLVSEIDPTHSDTAAFCTLYQIGMDVTANCVIVEAKRAERTGYAAFVGLATT